MVGDPGWILACALFLVRFGGEDTVTDTCDLLTLEGTHFTSTTVGAAAVFLAAAAAFRAAVTAFAPNTVE